MFVYVQLGCMLCLLYNYIVHTYVALSYDILVHVFLDSLPLLLICYNVHINNIYVYYLLFE